MKCYLKLLGVALLCCPACKTADQPDARERLLPGFEWLYNGQDLNNWYVVTDDKGEDKDLFVADRDGVHVYKNQEALSTQSFGGLITKEDYRSFTLSFEYRWGEKKFRPRQDYVRDAGVVFHVHGEDKIWPNGVECQIQEGDTGDLWLIGTRVSSRVNPVVWNYNPDGELQTKGDRERRFQRFPRSFSWEKPGWNLVELQVDEDHARFLINGHLVNEAIDMKYWDENSSAWLPLKSGKMLLQAEGAEIYYRNIQIRRSVD